MAWAMLRMLLMLTAARAVVRAALSAGNRIPINRAMTEQASDSLTISHKRRVRIPLGLSATEHELWVGKDRLRRFVVYVGFEYRFRMTALGRMIPCCCD